MKCTFSRKFILSKVSSRENLLSFFYVERKRLYAIMTIAIGNRSTNVEHSMPLKTNLMNNLLLIVVMYC